MKEEGSGVEAEGGGGGDVTLWGEGGGERWTCPLQEYMSGRFFGRLALEFVWSVRACGIEFATSGTPCPFLTYKPLLHAISEDDVEAQEREREREREREELERQGEREVGAEERERLREQVQEKEESERAPLLHDANSNPFQEANKAARRRRGDDEHSAGGGGGKEEQEEGKEEEGEGEEEEVTYPTTYHVGGALVELLLVRVLGSRATARMLACFQERASFREWCGGSIMCSVLLTYAGVC